LNKDDHIPIAIWNRTPPGFQASYGQPEPTLTPYLVESDSPTAAIIVCPGGGYAIHACHESEPVASSLAQYVRNRRFCPGLPCEPVPPSLSAAGCAKSDPDGAPPLKRVEHRSSTGRNDRIFRRRAPVFYCGYSFRRI